MKLRTLHENAHDYATALFHFLDSSNREGGWFISYNYASGGSARIVISDDKTLANTRIIVHGDGMAAIYTRTNYTLDRPLTPCFKVDLHAPDSFEQILDWLNNHYS